ncbi:MAG: dephospho-CoA kinase [Candidatus Melainabacteria bacterium GWF2_32_7]|nr:MAG: dephospho-CoA kinase [Candidatus Melainabacteria bacterium GWF2_32_7]
MIKLGITGNIASGKNLVESFLKEEGIPVIDSDKIVHHLLETDKEVIKQVYELFQPLGIDVRNEKGSISREKVGKIVFQDEEKRKELEKILHPIVKSKIEEFFYKNKKNKIVAATVPLLFEAHMEKMFDYIAAVTVDKDIQLERLMQRSNLTKEEALKRINAQMPQEEKSAKANFRIDNSGSIENTQIQVKQLLNKLYSN